MTFVDPYKDRWNRLSPEARTSILKARRDVDPAAILVMAQTAYEKLNTPMRRLAREKLSAIEEKR